MATVEGAGGAAGEAGAGAPRLGLNLMAWSGSVDRAALDLLPGIAALGYDGVELPVFRPQEVDPPAVRRALADSGLACTVSSALPRHLTLLDAAPRGAAVEFIARCAGVAAACGATLLCGPLYAPVGALPGRPRTGAEWEACVEGLRAAGGRVAGEGVTLAVEVLNRFETHFLNTAADAVDLLRAVDHPAVRLHLDTFHMNVEEKGVPAAVAVAGGWLAHVHAAENDRGIPGSGQVDWIGLRDALRAGGYGGWVVAETFTGAIPEIAAATAVWRPLVPDGWTYARESLAFLRRLFAP